MPGIVRRVVGIDRLAAAVERHFDAVGVRVVHVDRAQRVAGDVGLGELDATGLPSRDEVAIPAGAERAMLDPRLVHTRLALACDQVHHRPPGEIHPAPVARESRARAARRRGDRPIVARPSTGA